MEEDGTSLFRYRERVEVKGQQDRGTGPGDWTGRPPGSQEALAALFTVECSGRSTLFEREKTKKRLIFTFSF